MKEECTQCTRPDCDGTHICLSCGKDAPTPLEVDGDFFCDKDCLANNTPEARKLIEKMSKLKSEAAEAGIKWIN